MTLSGFTHSIPATALLFLVNTSVSLRAEQATDNWLRSTGDELQICLRGEVFEQSGGPATNLTINGGLNTSAATQAIEPKVDGHRFEVWIPVNKVRSHSMWLKAATASEDRVAYLQLNAEDLRQAAIDGIKLTLQSPTRFVQVKVIDAGRPVTDAFVKADLGFGIELRSRTGSDGIARFGLLPQQNLSGFTAWTDDLRIGGFSFHRKPTRDPDANDHVVELSKCRDQRLRFVDQTGSPVPDIDFVIQMATASDYNFIGTNEHSRMKTDAAGEVMYRWFPDWDKHFFYADLNTSQWVLDGENGDKQFVDGTAVFKLKKGKDRKRVHGSVVSTSTGIGGFLVTLDSFQGEEANKRDVIYTFADSAGKFSVDVLPDATYCASVDDSRWVGEIVDLIPYQSASDQVSSPKLSVSEGQAVEVTVTSGPQKRPYPNLGVSFRREHHYSWRENGQLRNGNGGSQWWATTDGSGRVTTRTLPGKLRVSAYTPLWQTEETVEVRSGEVTKIQLHRAVEEKQKVRGRLLLADGLESNLADAEIHIGSVDGNYDDRQTLKSSKDGSFSFETLSANIAVFGHTQDGRAAGSIIVKDLTLPVKLHLRPTIDYHGQLLGDGDQPLIGHHVHARVRVERDQDDRAEFNRGFEAKRIRATTDRQGNFILRGLPIELKVSIFADAIDQPTASAYLGEIYLEPNESRPRAVNHLGKTSRQASEGSLAERYQKTLRDCALSGFHVMVIASGSGEKETEFVQRNFIDYETNSDVSSFMQIVVASGQTPRKPTDAKFLNERDWQVPGAGRVFACAINSSGKELGRIEIDLSDKGAIKAAADFMHQHAPPQVDAEQKWQAAFAEASRTNRRVWVRISQRYCGPCFRFARWLDDHQDLLEKDYVMLKIDDVRDKNGARVAERLTLGKHHGIPFHAIFDRGDVMLINSAGPLGNVGHPSGFEGKKQLRKMLITTRNKLTDAEVDQLVESLDPE